MSMVLAKVPDYSADDFYNTSAPYEFLHQYKDDKFMLSQMREKLKAQAAKVGVRGFIGLWNAYLETVNQQRGISMDNATQFEGQSIELFSGQYICDEYGVTTTDRFGYEQTICRCSVKRC